MMASKNFLELYFHIPFCIRKCLYCDFLSGPVAAPDRDAYMKALLLETEQRAPECREYTVSSIFIGGGTPSAVDGEWIEELLHKVRTLYHTSSDMEITIEVNPGTADREKLRLYRRAGVNRLSMGLQSANDAELQRLGRIHTYEEFLQVYTMAREEGFTNINVDVMSALPGQDKASYRETLEKVLQLGPEHISAYSLIVEEGTPFYEKFEKGDLKLPDEDTEREMYVMTEKLLGERGYQRYEISNYALLGKECRHNIGYWNRTDYLGLGIGAASLMNNCRFSNSSELEAYIRDPMAQRTDMQQLSLQEQMEETMYLGLRMLQGVSEQGFSKQFGMTMEQVYQEVINRNIRDGLLRYETAPDGSDRALVLTDRGLDLSNYVMAQFLF